jgi:hypothetical protein
MSSKDATKQKKTIVKRVNKEISDSKEYDSDEHVSSDTVPTKKVKKITIKKESGSSSTPSSPVSPNPRRVVFKDSPVKPTVKPSMEIHVKPSVVNTEKEPVQQNVPSVVTIQSNGDSNELKHTVVYNDHSNTRNTMRTVVNSIDPSRQIHFVVGDDDSLKYVSIESPEILITCNNTKEDDSTELEYCSIDLSKL